MSQRSNDRPQPAVTRRQRYRPTRIALWMLFAMWSQLLCGADHGAHLIEVIDPPPRQDKAIKSATVIEQRGNVLLIEQDGDYDAYLDGGQPNLQARRDVAEAALRHGQPELDTRYDFVVVFTDFPVDLGQGIAGLNWSVRNDVSGIGRPLYDNSAAFGSARLLSIIDMADPFNAPVAYGSAEEDQVLDTLMHELMHQWGSYLHIDAPGLAPDALLGRSQSHWSALLSTDASVMYGSRWQLLPDGRARAIGVREHYGPLDLYAAGWLASTEVPAFDLLQSSELDASELPQLGLEIAAGVTPLSIDQVIAANGPRQPDHQASQKHFRAALVLLKRPGVPISTSMIDRLEALRVRAQDRFASITLGRASLLLGYEAPAAAASLPQARQGAAACGEPGLPACGSGLPAAANWLLANQQADGSWSDKPQTRVRDTILATQALQALDTNHPAIAAARAYLATSSAPDLEQRALLLHSALLSPAAETALQQDIEQAARADGYGDGATRVASALETAAVLAAYAAHQQRGGSGPPLAPIREQLLALRRVNPVEPLPTDAQHCWARELDGPCDALTSLLALEALLAAGMTPAQLALDRAILFSFDDSPGFAHQATVLRLAAELDLADDPRALARNQQLRAAQRPDGSWSDSVPLTAQSLLWIHSRNLPDLRVSGGPDWGTATPVVGLPLRLQFTIANDGGVAAPTVQIALEARPSAAPEGAPWLPIAELPSPPLVSGDATSMQADWETAGLVPGPYHLRLRVDSEATLTELSELNNASEREIVLAAPPQAADLLILPGAMVTPQVLNQVPLPLSVHAEVMNLGQTQATPSIARVYALRFGQLLPLAEQSISLAPGERQLLQIEAVIADPDINALRLILDAEQSLVESNEGNNLIELPLLTQAAVDLEVRAEDLSISPASVEQGQALRLSAILHNRGTRLSPTFRIRLRVRDQTATERTLLEQDLQIDAGESAVRHYDWTADRSGPVSLIIDLDPSDLVSEVREDNNEAQIDLSVLPSTLPNLAIAPGSLVLDPDPVLAGAATQLSLLINNSATASSPSTDVTIYLSDPDQPTTMPWGSGSVPAMAGESSQVVSFALPALEGRGIRTLFARVDASQQVAEANEEDNDELRQFELRALPDLEVRSAALSSVPSLPAPGAAARLNVAVSNLGEQPALAAMVTVERIIDGIASEASPPQQIAELPAGTEVTLQFPYERPTDPGSFALRVRVDSANTVTEGDEDNNLAELSIGDLDPNLYVTEEFISPNGDGIKDSTEIVARVPTAQDLRVRIVSSWGEEVFRAEGGALNNTTVVSVPWDGRRQDGRRALDDRYAVRIESAAGDLLGLLAVTVDTNNSPLLQAFHTGHDRYASIGTACDADNHRQSPSPGDTYHPASESLISLWELDPGELALYRSPLNGQPATRILRLNDLHVGAITSTQQWSVERSDEIAVVLIAQEVSGLVYELHALRIDRPVTSRLVWSGSEHPGYRHATLELDWAVFSTGDGLAAINMQTGERRVLTATQPDRVLDRTDNALLYQIHGPAGSRLLHQTLTESIEAEIAASHMVAVAVGDGRFGIAAETEFDEIEPWYYDSLHVFDPAAVSPLTMLQLPAEPGASYHLIGSMDAGELVVLRTAPAAVLRWNLDSGLVQQAPLPFAFTAEPEANTDLEPGHRLRAGFRYVNASPNTDRWHFEAFLLADNGGDGSYEFLDNDHVIVDPSNLQLDLLPELGRQFPVSLHEYPLWIGGETQALGYESGVLINRGFIQRAAFAQRPAAIYSSPLAETMLLHQGSGDCESSGLRIVRSGANLGLELQLDFVAAYSGFLIRLTAEDQNLDHYRIDAKRLGVPGAQAIYRGSSPRLDSAVAIWSPPQPGVYEVTVEAWDKAGNRRQYSIPAHWFEHSQLGAVQIEERFLSPNGDGRLDQLRLQYETYGPLNVEIVVRNAAGTVVHQHEAAQTAAGSYSYHWSGFDPQGQPVADGDYEIAVNNRRLSFVVDTTPPLLALNEPREGLPPNDVVCDWEPSQTSASDRRVFIAPVPAVDASADELHWKSARYQSRGRQPGTGWRDAELVVNPQDPDVFLQWIFHSGEWGELDHRLLVDDLAGNQSIAALLAPMPFISAMTFSSDAVAKGALQSGTVWWVNFPRGERISIPATANADLGEVYLEIVDPRVAPSATGLAYRTSLGHSGTLALNLDASSGVQVSAPDRRCVVSGAKVYRATLPQLAPLEKIEFLLTGTGIPRDFDQAYRGEWFSLVGEQSDCQIPPRIGDCQIYSQSEILVPLLWCPVGTEVAFGRDSTAHASFLDLTNRLAVPDPTSLIPAGTNGCPLALTGPLSTCPDGYACNCVRTSIAEFPIGDVWTAQRALGLPADSPGPNKTSQFYGRVSGQLPVVELDHPLPGDRVCSGAPLVGQVSSEVSPTIEGRIRFEGREFPALEQGSLPLSGAAPLVATYPMGIGVVLNRPYRVGPEAGNDENLLFTEMRADLGPGGTPLLLPDGASIELDLWASNVCQGPGPVVTRNMIVDLGTLIDGFRISVPTGVAPPFYYTPPVPQRGFSPALGQQAQFSAVLGEPLWGSLSVVDLYTGTTVATLATGPFTPGVLTQSWTGLDDAGLAVADGVYHFVPELQDACGNELKRQFPIYVDSTPPTVSILSPAPSQFAGALVPVVLEVADYRHVRAEIHLRRLDPIHGHGAWVPQAQITTHLRDRYSWTWEAGRFSPGTYEFRARAIDEVGNIGQWSVVEVIIPERPELIGYAAATPTLISPNADGVLDALVLDILLNQPVPLAVTVETPDQTLVATLEPEFLSQGTYTAHWNGTDLLGAVVPDGEYYLRLRAGEEGSASGLHGVLVRVEVDNAPPIIEAQIANGAFVSSSDELVVEFTDAHPLRWEIASVSVIPHLIPEGENFGEQTVLAWERVEEGDHELRIRAFDSAGNSAVETLTVTLDQTPPIALITFPADGDLLTRGSAGVEVVGIATDLHPASWTLEAEGADGLAHPVATGNGEIDGPLGHWLAADSDGDYSLRLRVVDLAGNESEHQIEVVLDNTPPAVTISSPADGSWLGSGFAVSGSVADAHLLSHTLEIAPRLGGSPSWESLSNGTESISSGLIASVLSPRPDGPYVLRLRAEDRVGLVGEAFLDVEIDTGPPLPPLALSAVREGVRDVRLSWSASPSADAVAYRLFRDGQLLVELAGLSHLDQSLGDGERRYQVTAVDRAGNESAPSNDARIRIDTTPPDVRILVPQAQSRVRAEVTVRGRAHSQDDFDRYRLSLTSAAAPGAPAVLLEGGNPTLGGPLATWDSRAHPDGDYGLLLEAWDFNQNRAETSVLFTVDNTPPAAPTGVLAQVDDNAVDLSWQPNSEPDLAGYLVYRGPVLLNGSNNADPRSIVFTATSHRVESLGDGSHDFRVLAVDTTGNLSDPSAPANAELSGHPPRVVLIRPLPGTVFEQPILTRGSTTDQDIVEVLLQYQLQGSGAWTNFGPPFTEPPYERSFLPPDLAYGQYQLRALATDSEGLTDPDPPQVAAEYRDLTAPDAPLGLAASIDGGTVSLSWSAPQATDVDRYRVERQPLPQGSWQSVGEVPAPQLALVDAGLADGRYGYRVQALDGFDNVSVPSASIEVRIYTPLLQQPYAPGNVDALLLTARSPVAGQAELERVASNGSEPLTAPALSADIEVQLPVNLLRGLNEFRLRVVEDNGNRSKEASVMAAFDADPVAPTGLTLQVDDHEVSLQWNANPEDSIRGYRLFRRGASVLVDADQPPVDVLVYSTGSFAYSEPVLFDGDPATRSHEFLNSERDRFFEVELAAESLVVALQLHGVPQWDATHIVRLHGYWQDRWIELPSTVERSGESLRVIPQQPYVASRIRVALRSTVEFADLPVGEIDLRFRPLFDATSHVETLADGAYLYRVSGVNEHGFEGPRSEAVEAQVGDAQPPDAVVLNGVQADADVSLSWSASMAPDLAAYRLYRRGQLLLETTDLDQRSYLDAALTNGVYDYQLFAVDQVGNAAGSNVLVYTVSGTLPAAPLNLSVVPVDGGGALRLQWSPGMGAPATQYQIGRSLQAAGPFQPVGQVPAAQTELTDSGLQNGTRYYYVVAALDARGNRSADSNVASGVPFANQRLATPVFVYPTQHGQSLSLPGPDTTLAGSAEADSSLLVGYRDQVLPTIALPGEPEQIGVGYGGERMAFSGDGGWAWLDYGYSSFLQPLHADGGDQIELGQTCAKAQWISATELLHCDGQTVPQRLLWVDARDPAQSEVWLTQAGIRGFSLSPDGRQLLLLASFDWPDGTRESLALRTDEGPWIELTVDAGDLDADALQIDPSGRWALLRRLSDERLLLLTLASGVLVEPDLLLAPRTPVGFHPDQPIAVLAAAGPAGQGLYRIDLHNAAIEWLDLGLDFPVGAGFAPLGDRLHALGSDQWRLYDWPQLDLLQSLDVYEAQRLQDLATGEALLSTADGYGELSWLRPAGVFRIEGVPLSPGENLMTALSTRPGQLNSFPALPITILVPTDGLPDLEVRASDLSLLPNQVRPGDQPRLGARVRNLGSGPSAQASASLVLSTPAGGLNQPPRVIPPLPPGSEALLVWQLPALDEPGPHLALVQLDPTGQLVERSTANNRAQLGFAVSADGAPELQLSAQPTLLAPTQRLNGEVQILPGGLAIDGRLRVRVVTPSGQLVVGLIDQPVSVPAVGTLPAQPLQWTPGTVAAGEYQLQASLFDGAGTLRAQQALPLSVSAFRTLSMSSSARVASLPSGMPIRLDTQLHYLAGNTPIEAATLRARLETVEGDVLAESEQPLPTLSPGYSGVLESLLLPDPVAPAGQYLLRAELWTQSLLAESAAVQLITEPASLPRLEGSLLLPAVPLPIGEGVVIDLLVRNSGEVALSGIPLRATLRRSLQAAPLATLEQSIDLAVGAEWNGQLLVPSHLLGLGDQLVSLSVIDGPQAGVLAFGSFRVVDTLAPALSVVTPPPGSIVPAHFRLDARAIDQHHPLANVRLQRSGQEWLPMSTGIAFAGHYQRSLGPLVDGPLSLRLDAADAVGNGVETGPVLYTVDATPPLVQISGVDDGGLYNATRMPVIEIIEANPASSQILLNGEPFVSGMPVASDGAYTLYVLARDAAGNEGSAIVSFVIDLTPPPVAFSAPAPGSVIATPETLVLVSSEAQAQVTLNHASGSLQATADAQGLASFAAVPLVEGANTLQATARDAAGNVSAPAELMLTRSAATLSAVAGELQLAAVYEPPAPIAGQWQLQNLSTLLLDQLPLRIELREGLGGALLAQQSLSVDLQPSGSLQADFGFASDALVLGGYAVALLAQLRDEQAQSVWVELAQAEVQLADLSPPQLTWLQPSDGQLVGAEPELRARVVDALAGVDRIELQLDGQLAGLLAPDPLLPDEYLALPGPLADGAYTATLQAFDLAGNEAGSERGLIVDASPPVIQISGVSDDQLSNQPLSPQIDIIEPHLASSEILLDGQPYLSGTPVTGEGAHLLSVSAVDQLGNATSREIGFTLDFTPPPLAFLSPADGLQIIAAHLPAELQSEPQALVELRTGTNLQSGSSAADGRVAFAAVPLQLGPNTLLASAMDAAGNRSAEISVTVTRVRPTQAVIEGFLTLLTSTVNHGEPLQGGFQIGNGGGFDPGPVTILVRVYSGSTLLEELSWPQLLPPSAIVSEAFSLASDDWPLGTLRIELRWRAEDEPGADPVLIDQRSVTVRDGTAPLAQILDPADGTVVGSTPTILAGASDVLSEVVEVAVRINGEAWQPMTAAALPDQYQASPFLPLIGYNLVEVRAVDAAQNAGFAEPIVLCRSSALGDPGDGLFRGPFEGEDQLFADSFEGSECDPPPLLRRVLRWTTSTAGQTAEDER